MAKYDTGWKNVQAILSQEDVTASELGWDLNNFKWFFNYMVFGPGELDQEVVDGIWDVVEVEPKLILKQGVELEKSLWWVVAVVVSNCCITDDDDDGDLMSPMKRLVIRYIVYYRSLMDTSGGW